MTAALGKVCKACGKERKKKGILYDPTDFMPYCENPYICSDEHPNSPKNLIERGEELKLVPIEDAEQRFKAWLQLEQPDKEKAQKIKRMVTQPITIRVGSPELAQFILDLQDEFNFNSVSDSIRYCIQQMKESKGTYYAHYKELAEEKEVETAKVELKQEVEKTVEKPAEKIKEEEEDELVF